MGPSGPSAEPKVQAAQRLGRAPRGDLRLDARGRGSGLELEAVGEHGERELGPVLLDFAAQPADLGEVGGEVQPTSEQLLDLGLLAVGRVHHPAHDRRAAVEGSQQLRRRPQLERELGDVVEAGGDQHLVGPVSPCDPVVGDPLLARGPAAHGDAQDLDALAVGFELTLELARERLLGGEPEPLGHAVPEDGHAPHVLGPGLAVGPVAQAVGVDLAGRPAERPPLQRVEMVVGRSRSPIVGRPRPPLGPLEEPRRALADHQQRSAHPERERQVDQQLAAPRHPGPNPPCGQGHRRTHLM